MDRNERAFMCISLLLIHRYHPTYHLLSSLCEMTWTPKLYRVSLIIDYRLPRKPSQHEFHLWIQTFVNPSDITSLAQSFLKTIGKK